MLNRLYVNKTYDHFYNCQNFVGIIDNYLVLHLEETSAVAYLYF